MPKRSDIDLGAIGSSVDSEPSPPRIIRETFGPEREYSTGIEQIDDALALWRSLRDAAGAVPAWSSFRPFSYPKLLPLTVTYEKKDGRYRCGLMGEAILEDLPVRFAGSYLDERMPATNLPDMIHRFDAALDSGEPNFVVKTMAWQPGYESRIYASLQLPFAGKHGVPSRIMSVMALNIES